MKIDELIQELEEVKEERGNLDIRWIEIDGWYYDKDELSFGAAEEY